MTNQPDESAYRQRVIQYAASLSDTLQELAGCVIIIDDPDSTPKEVHQSYDYLKVLVSDTLTDIASLLPMMLQMDKGMGSPDPLPVVPKGSSGGPFD